VENGRLVNYYDLLMISPKADLKMLEAAVRILLARYNPKNPETGDEHHFELVKRAYLTLSDPHHRETYDQKIQGQEPSQAGEVSSTVTPEIVKSENKKRQGIIALLYRRMMANPHDPGMSTPQIEDILDLKHEQTLFAYWYLREQGLIARTENGSFCITSEGVAWAEEGGLPHLADGVAPSTFTPKPVHKAATAEAEPSQDKMAAGGRG
jgi:curved DNA-binding protein CbpA